MPENYAPKLIILPASISLTSGQAAIFTATSTTAVTWSLLPADDVYYGKLSNTGAYTAPKKFVARSRSAIIQASNATDTATATINITSEPFWRSFIGVFFILLLIPIVFLVKEEWPVAVKCGYAPVVTPPSSWVNPGQHVQLNLISCDAKPVPIFWKVATGAGTVSDSGLFLAGAAAEDDLVEALDGTQKVIGAARVHVTIGTPLGISPPSFTLAPGQRQGFTVGPIGAPNPIAWFADPPVGDLQKVATNPKQQTFVAPLHIKRRSLVRLIASVVAPPAAANGPPGNLTVEAIVQLQPPDDPKSEKRIFWFVFWMGVLGSYIHAAGSFAAFAGNRTFVSSWTWWYMLRPVTGGLLALLVFFLFGGGVFGQGDVSNAYLVATYAGLVGLFSELALLKLKEIMESLLKPKDDRADKLREGAASDSSRPTITGITVEDAASRTYAVAGTNFDKESTVEVGGSERKTTYVGASKLTFTLADDDKGALKITVLNRKSDGTVQESLPFSLQV